MPLKVEPRIVDALVEHALTGGGPIERRKETKPESIIDGLPGIEVPDIHGELPDND